MSIPNECPKFLLVTMAVLNLMTNWNTVDLYFWSFICLVSNGVKIGHR